MTPARTRTGGAQEFQDLMRRRVQDILLVASPYDAFILEEDGQLNERLLGHFLELGLRHTPGLTRVTSGAEAVARARAEPRFNLIVTATQVGDMNAVELAGAVREAGLDVPVVLLAFDGRQLSQFLARHDTSQIERVFLWQGDVQILLGIVHTVEDRWNAPHDSGVAGVPLLLVVEDSVRYYSSFLPMIHAELVRHAQRLLSEGANLSQKILRMRARPKVLLASTYEDAWQQVLAYKDSLLAVISDMNFPMDGVVCEDAGARLARQVKALEPDVPIVLQSSRPENAALAEELDAAFLLKGSPVLLQELRRCMVEGFGFGDFVFARPDGTAVARAPDLRALEAALATVPAESLLFHAERNHFSKWLRARAFFRLAEKLRPRRVSEYPDVEALREDLIRSITDYRAEQRALVVEDFDPATFEGGRRGFWRVGGGSLGGKARGLAFVRRLLAETGLDRRFPGVQVQVPASVVVATDVFDQFLEENGLRDFVLHCPDDAEVRARVMAARFPSEPRAALRAFVERVRWPLAVRSSSLLEDSQHQPFSGVYATYMLSNAHPDPEVRLDALLRAVQAVYASTFSQHAKAYLAATPYRLEEEKMAVLVQRMVGAPHGGRFYPEVSGVARSYNFYPTPPLRAEDGIVAAALGLGRAVVEGGRCLRFSPRHPRHLLQFSSVPDVLRNSQREFWALALDEPHLGMDPEQEMREARFDLDAAEADGTLSLLASTYCAEDGAVRDGISRPGARVVSFAPMLKHGLFPLADLTHAALEVAADGMGGPVEVEFAAALDTPAGEPKEFAFLQLRPLVVARDRPAVELGELDPARVLVRSPAVLGNGEVEGIRDLVVVDQRRYDRARSQQVAREVALLNATLVATGTPYVLVGVGRWGSNDPWLGVPVRWDDIAGARVIVEAGFKDFAVTPSQGSHFFQNVTSFQVGFFTVDEQAEGGHVDWDWLAGQPAVSEHGFVRHLRLERPLVVRMDGRRRAGVILKGG